MGFSPRFLDELRQRVGLVDRIGRRVKLVRRGHEHLGLCPFHNEKTPSFTVNEDKGFFHCFGCGAHGDVIGFVMRTENLSFPETVEILAGEAGLALPVSSPEERRRADEAVSLFTATEAATAFFEATLAGPEGAQARAYLARRGLSEESRARFRLGYAPESRTRLKSALMEKGIPESLLVTAGLLVVPEDGRPSYDRFRGRLIFPIFDPRGRPIAFGGRLLGEGQPKYLNSPETPLFEKGQCLYGWSHALRPAREGGRLLVAEGYMDVIALTAAGLPAVAPLGTALTESQILSLWRLVPEPILCFDGDAAGARAASRAAQRALPLLKPGHSFRFMRLPGGEDPDSLIKARGARGMDSLIESARPLSEVVWDMETLGQPVDTPERRALLRQKLLARAAAITEPSVGRAYRDEFLRRLDEAFADFSPVAGARRRLSGSWPQGLRPRPAFERLKSDPLLGAGEGSAEARERVLVATVLNHPDLLADVVEEFTAVAIGSHEYDSLRLAILDVVACGEGEEASSLAAALEARGFGRSVATLTGARARVLDWFARPDAPREDALAGFRQALALHRHFGILQEQILAAESALAEMPTEANWRRFQALKEESARLQLLGEDNPDFGPPSRRVRTGGPERSEPAPRPGEDTDTDPFAIEGPSQRIGSVGDPVAGSVAGPEENGQK